MSKYGQTHTLFLHVLLVRTGPIYEALIAITKFSWLTYCREYVKISLVVLTVHNLAYIQMSARDGDLISKRSRLLLAWLFLYY